MNDPGSRCGNESSKSPPRDASVEQWLRWLTQARETDAASRLDKLLGNPLPETDVLVELIAVDLIRGWRSGDRPVVEDYLLQFPALKTSDPSSLDLIDTELCVRREVDSAPSLESLEARFPELKQQLRQLFFLEEPSMPSASPPASPPSRTRESIGDTASMPPHLCSPISSSSILSGTSRTGVPLDSSNRSAVKRPAGKFVPPDHHPDRRDSPPPDHDDSIDVKIPINPPPWMTGVRCIGTQLESGHRSWLIKGRDAEHGESVAMKIIPLSDSIDRDTRTRILDLCELASGVSHPAWVAPRIAAINNGHLAVIRPWVFGSPFESHFPAATSPTRMESLVRIGFALAAAHRAGATHGAVHSRNLILGHDNDARLVDCCSSRRGWGGTMATLHDDLQASAPDRIQRDARGFLSMIADEFIQTQSLTSLRWIGEWGEKIRTSQADVCAIIAEHLQTLLDSHLLGGAPTDGTLVKRSWWKR